ncbi:RNA binding predicted protein [Blumeria hordei DH14]|uniref:Snorna binding protein n=1 Tax=Blumeria graminis f. sp. hordei (strain DH14) TaxID=546991 RepID=N1JDJ2_BLUG1|nr:RNA binding predicted protein [Blumeria hordei DH14]
MASKNRGRNLYAVLQSIFFATILYFILYVAALVIQRGSLPRTTTDFYSNPSIPGIEQLAADNPKHSNDALPNQVQLDKIIINANWFNRPESSVVIRDDFMGRRPHVDTVANITKLVHECRGSYENIERMPYVYDCLKYLQTGEKEYFYLPPSGERASEQPPSQAEYLNSDGQDNTLPHYPPYREVTKESIGQCNGPIIPYHVYWTGPASWRVELFIKSYLYTQNIPCSRLWIWLDGDRDPESVDKMLHHDPIFSKFISFVKRGDIILKTWRFPPRIPLPHGDNTDGAGYYKTPGKPNLMNETTVAEGLIRDANNQEWLVLTEKQMTFLPVAVSDAVRFVVLHIYGGAYFDMDVIMLRDMRPLLIAEDHGFAERWGGHASPGDYNTAIMSLSANSSLSSYLLRGGVRMGLNFHPRVIGVMAVKDRRNHELHMLETAFFDPIWTEFNWGRLGPCTVPCFHDYGQIFKGGKTAFPLKDEWEAFTGEQLKSVRNKEKDNWKTSDYGGLGMSKIPVEEDLPVIDKSALEKAKYIIEQDPYPPSNRTLENFFRGAWTYHVHNQWTRKPEPSSWLNVLQRAQDGFFLHDRKNPYGEKWTGPELTEYEVSWEYI